MRREEVTALVFAKWSLERDVSVGLWSKRMTWEKLPEAEKQLYLEEADLYLALNPEEWPIDILERLEDK